MTFADDPLRLTARLMRQRPGLFLLNAVLWTVVHVSPVAYGVLMRGLFDALGRNEAAATSAWTFLALAVAVDGGRMLALGGAIYAFAGYFIGMGLHLRRNLLRHLLTAPGARRLPDSPSEAVTRFRDDVNDVTEYVENWVDAWGVVGFGVVALGIMARVDVTMTALVCLPLLATLVVTGALRPVIRRARRASREATGRVTDFLGETFGGVQAVKACGREGSAIERYRRLNDARRGAALRDTLLTEGFRSATDNMVHLATGLVLLLAAGALRDGRFTVGDFALFVAYLPRLTNAMSFVGLMLVQHKRTGVAFERLGRLLVDARAEDVVAPAPLDVARRAAPYVHRERPVEAFRSLEVRGLRYRHPGAATGIEGVDLRLRRGEFVVITGRVGAGKTTLLRVLLGLLPRQGGELRLNGHVVADPSRVLVPPLCAYTGQVPRLFSATLRENVVLGRPVGEGELRSALDRAVLREDVEAMERGLESPVGTRGVRLSGGQVQRAAAARMFLTGAEVLVFDDLSSALDVDTEGRLWDRLFETGERTCLVVSNRRTALERADRVVLLERGRVAASGTLEHVLAASEDLRLVVAGWGDPGPAAAAG